jgi:hypothetical protein
MQFPKNQPSKFTFIAKTLAYKDPHSGAVQVLHLIPKMSLGSQFREIYSRDDKKIIEHVSNQGVFVSSFKDFSRFRMEPEPLFYWQLKIVLYVLVHCREGIKLLAYDQEIERLMNLVCALQTAGFVTCHNSNLFAANGREKTKDKRN